ncbi:exodeoxyribonuclease VII large subunit [Marinicrinis lubricantis]|uniref:Exodeoxyribonuclease 7 large subunit n=1 Tax=Marinicrinis lubricantis TaxID=2086470 RepID=A0ABW1IRK7_9BACL
MTSSSQERVLTVKELTRWIKLKLEKEPLFNDVWVQGEISNFTRHSSGHMYFTLKDKDSRIKCVMFASQNRYLKFLPKEGSKVLARGSVSVFERDGQYQFYVNQMQPDGVGSLYLAYEQLKQRLEQEGLFAPERKRPIPKIPKAIGIVTSPTGAAIRDMIITLQRRFPSVPILLYPASVQGTLAVPSIVKGIEIFNRLNEVDVIIVGRGGGSLEELWAFNEEKVARSIHASQIPIISAVGHETDFTIADFVADLRAATPTAAAELAVPHVLDLRQQIGHFRHRLGGALTSKLQESKDRLERLKSSAALQQPKKNLLHDAYQQVDRFKEQLVYQLKNRLHQSKSAWMVAERSLLKHHPQERVASARKDASSLQKQLKQSMSDFMKTKKQFFASEIRQLDALSPLKIMNRGYSLVYDETSQKLIKSVEQVQLGDILKIRLKDGQLDCQVWSMKGEEQHGGE